MRIRLIVLFNIFVCYTLSADKIEDSYIDNLLGNSNRKSVMINSYSSVTVYNKDNLDFQIISPDISISYNSAYPYTMNDGALWKGKGLSSQIQGGVEYISKFFQARFYPNYWVTQNSDFDLIETNYNHGEYGHYWGSLDSLQRYGDSFYHDFDLGQTDIRFNYFNYFTFGLSNENISLGSSKLNPLLLSNNASGFLHVDYGTNGILSTPYGGLEIRFINGITEESDFYDNDSSNDKGFLNLLTFGYSPIFLNGFSIGLNILYLKPLNNVDSTDFISLFSIAKQIFTDGGRGGSTNPGSDDKDTMASVNIDWFEPEWGIHIYMEWGRTDFGIDTSDLLRSPEHTQAFTLGFSKILNKKNNSYFLLSAEFTSIEQDKSYMTCPGGSWYRHGWSGWRQGYTNKGQNLGAAIGPGSNSQYLGLDYIINNLRFGGFIQRIAYDNDYYYNIYIEENNVGPGTDRSNYNNYSVIDANRIELSFGLHSQVTLKSFEYSLGIISSYHMNRNYIPKNDIMNFNIDFNIKYLF